MFRFTLKKGRNHNEWKLYTEFMYPNPRQYQCIMNQRVVQNLETNGDTLIKERKVDHWIYFKTQEDKQHFLNEIKDDGFQVTNEDYNVDSTDRPYSLQIARVDYVDIESVNDYTLNLWELAEECNGEYDGWETLILRE